MIRTPQNVRFCHIISWNTSRWFYNTCLWTTSINSIGNIFLLTLLFSLICGYVRTIMAVRLYVMTFELPALLSFGYIVIIALWVCFEFIHIYLSRYVSKILPMSFLHWYYWRAIDHSFLLGGFDPLGRGSYTTVLIIFL